MKFRKYKKKDAETIVKWIKNERELRLWSADKYGNFPITPNQINENYEKEENFYPMSLEDNGKIVGHLILRHPNEDKSIIRLGYVIVDSEIRGKGYGKILLKEAIEYAKENLNPKEINLIVFNCNKTAHECYKSVGFRDVSIKKDVFCFQNENWDCIKMVLEK